MADKTLRLPLPLYACIRRNPGRKTVLLWDLDAQSPLPSSSDNPETRSQGGVVLPLFTSIDYAARFLATINQECDISHPLDAHWTWYYLTSPPGFGPTTQMDLVIDLISPTDNVLIIPRKPVVDELDRIIEAKKLGTG